MLAGGAAAAWQPYCHLEQMVRSGPISLSKQVAFLGHALQYQGRGHQNLGARGMDVISKFGGKYMVRWGQFFDLRKIYEILDIFSHPVS